VKVFFHSHSAHVENDAVSGVAVAAAAAIRHSDVGGRRVEQWPATTLLVGVQRCGRAAHRINTPSHLHHLSTKTLMQILLGEDYSVRSVI